MPWVAEDARKHTAVVVGRGPKAGKQWAAVANSVLARGGDEGEAVREASGVVKREYGRNPSKGEARERQGKARGRLGYPAKRGVKGGRR